MRKMGIWYLYTELALPSFEKKLFLTAMGKKNLLESPLHKMFKIPFVTYLFPDHSVIFVVWVVGISQFSWNFKMIKSYSTFFRGNKKAKVVVHHSPVIKWIYLWGQQSFHTITTTYKAHLTECKLFQLYK